MWVHEQDGCFGCGEGNGPFAMPADYLLVLGPVLV